MPDTFLVSDPSYWVRCAFLGVPARSLGSFVHGLRGPILPALPSFTNYCKIPDFRHSVGLAAKLHELLGGPLGTLFEVSLPRFGYELRPSLGDDRLTEPPKG
eukprot:7839392-Heterocapsa_arctica.AAC.1